MARYVFEMWSLGSWRVPLFRNTVEIEMKGEAHYNEKNMVSMVSQNLYDCILTLDLLIKDLWSR